MTAPPALPDDLLSTITAWTQQDPDPVTRSQVEDLIYAAKTGDLAAVAELTDAFTGRLQFGTAGLRGPLGPGPNRMNRVVVGSQIVPPAEADIATRISEIARHDLNDVPRSTDYSIVGSELVSAYLGRIASLVPGDADRDLRWVYTPLHGVGAAVVAGAVAAGGFPAASVVADQAEPNPAFPTVAFPNPEEPGAIDLALAQAERTRADLVVANDPDADRCAVAVPIGGHWRMLRGDELGALLADDALRRKVHGTYACSIVSSSLLSAMAAESGQPFTYTLTGFKWIGRVPGLAFGYEEALGYCVDPAAVPDKDGISALVRVLALAAECKAQRSSLADRLDDIARRYGIYETDQLSVRVDDLKVIADAMARLRARPPKSRP